MACTEAAEGLALCFTCGDAPISTAHQEAWGWSTAKLTEAARSASAAAVSTARPMRQEVHDMPGRAFWVTNLGDGYDMAAFLHPEQLAAALGTPAPIVAVPGEGFLMAWAPGDEELDTVMAVGIKQMHSRAARPVSDKLYRYQEGEWVVWGEARKADPF